MDKIEEQHRRAILDRLEIGYKQAREMGGPDGVRAVRLVLPVEDADWLTFHLNYGLPREGARDEIHG